MRRKANRFLAAVRAAQDDNADKSSQTDPETPSAQMEDASARSVPELTCTCCPIHTMNTRMGIDEDAITQSVPELISTCCPLIHTRSTQMENNEELREDASVPKIICTCCPVHTMTAQSETQDVPKLTCTCCRIHTTTNPDSPPESPVTIMSRELRTSKGRANAFISYMRADRHAQGAEQVIPDGRNPRHIYPR